MDEQYYDIEVNQIIRLWNQCHSAECIADALGVDVEYVEATIDEQSAYKEGQCGMDRQFLTLGI